jgi:hypothetical protein
MTRERIADGLEILFLQLANGDSALPPGWQPHEWQYIKGLASGAIWNIRARFVVAGQP